MYDDDTDQDGMWQLGANTDLYLQYDDATPLLLPTDTGLVNAEVLLGSYDGNQQLPPPPHSQGTHQPDTHDLHDFHDIYDLDSIQEPSLGGHLDPLPGHLLGPLPGQGQRSRPPMDMTPHKRSRVDQGPNMGLNPGSYEGEGMNHGHPGNQNQTFNHNFNPNQGVNLHNQNLQNHPNLSQNPTPSRLNSLQLRQNLMQAFHTQPPPNQPPQNQNQMGPNQPNQHHTQNQFNFQSQPPNSTDTNFPKSSFYVGGTLYIYDTLVLGLMFKARETASTKQRIQRIDLNAPNGRGTLLRRVAPLIHFVLKDDQTIELFQQLARDVDAIEQLVAPHGQTLVNLFFRIIHPIYPILHRLVFLEKYHRSHREFTAPLLAAVYVLAIQWWEYDPQLNRFPQPNVDELLRIGLTNFALEVLKRPKLSAVQAGLLLLQCKLVIDHRKLFRIDARNADYSDWVLCSQVVALAEEMGLGLDCLGWQLPKWERSLRKRLAWAVYMEDKWLALKNGRPSHIHPYNWGVLQMTERDFPERTQLLATPTPSLDTVPTPPDLRLADLEAGKKIFVHFVGLTRILADIITQFYLIRAMQEVTNLVQVLNLAKPLQLRLREWYQALPPELQMSLVQPRKLCANGSLLLAYFAAELTLHRRIITGLWHQQQGGNPAVPRLVEACHTAAKTRLATSISFVQELKPEHIHSFWHLCSLANFTLIGTFAALLYCTAPLDADRDYYRNQANHYRLVLQVLSKGFDIAAQALVDLDLVYEQIPGLVDTSKTPLASQPRPPGANLPPSVQGPGQTAAQRSRLELSGLGVGPGGPGPNQAQPFRMNSVPNVNRRTGLFTTRSPHSPSTLFHGTPGNAQDLLPKELIRQQMHVYDKSPHT